MLNFKTTWDHQSNESSNQTKIHLLDAPRPFVTQNTFWDILLKSFFLNFIPLSNAFCIRFINLNGNFMQPSIGFTLDNNSRWTDLWLVMFRKSVPLVTVWKRLWSWLNIIKSPHQTPQYFLRWSKTLPVNVNGWHR